MVKERRTIWQLRDYISQSMKNDTELSPILERMIRRFFTLRKNITNIQEQQQKEQQQQQQSNPTQSSNQRSGFARGSAPPNKRRRVRGGSVAAAASSSSSRPPLAETFKDDVQETIAMYVVSSLSNYSVD